MNWKEAYSNHGEENASRGERGLGWHHAGLPLRAVQSTNGRVQRGDQSTVLSLGFGRHGRNHEKAVWSAPNRYESDIARLVQSGPFGEEDYLTVAFEDVALSDHPLKLKVTGSLFVPRADIRFPNHDHETHILPPCRSATSPRTSGFPSRDPEGLHTVLCPIDPGCGTTVRSSSLGRCGTPPGGSPARPNTLARLPNIFAPSPTFLATRPLTSNF